MKLNFSIFMTHFQIPGRFVFSVLRKYLQLTSMVQQDELATPLPPIGPDGEQRELTDFEIFFLHYELFSELFMAFGWYEGTLEEDVQQGNDRVLKGLSIFTGTRPQEVKVRILCVFVCREGEGGKRDTEFSLRLVSQ